MTVLNWASEESLAFHPKRSYACVLAGFQDGIPQRFAEMLRHVNLIPQLTHKTDAEQPRRNIRHS